MSNKRCVLCDCELFLSGEKKAVWVLASFSFSSTRQGYASGAAGGLTIAGWFIIAEGRSLKGHPLKITFLYLLDRACIRKPKAFG